MSSGKIDAYEYLTGDEILPTNKQQMIEQAKLTYSPLGKAFEKQTKAMEDPGEKQIKAIHDKRPIKSTEDFTLSFKKIKNRDKKVDTNKLVFKYKGNTTDEDFSKFDNALDLINKIRDGEISLNETKDDQRKLRSDMGEAKRAQKNHLLKEGREERTNIENLYNTRKAAIDFFEEFTSRASEARRQAKKRTGLKILTPKQMLPRLPIALAEIKAGNNSDSLLNEIRQIVYSLNQSKEITKKVYNNIIKSIKV